MTCGSWTLWSRGSAAAPNPRLALRPHRSPPILANLAALALASILSAGGATTPPNPAPPAAASPAAPVPPPSPPPPPVPAPEPGYQALPTVEGEGWQSLFDGQTMHGWKVTEFAGHGPVTVQNGQMIIEMGATLSGVNGTNALPKRDYELTLDAMKKTGEDFFCGLTFPVGESCCTWIVGGWGGGVVGLSSIDGNDASSNETTKFLSFEKNRWYRLRVRVTAKKIEAWIGKDKMVDVELEGKRIGMRPGEIELNQPFGIATYETTGVLRNIQWRRLEPKP